MKGRYFFIGISVIVGGLLCARFMATRTMVRAQKNDSSNSALSLIIEPDDGVAPVLAMIRAAARSVDLVMYELDDAQVESALAAAAARGVAVRVILSTGYQGASSTVNGAAYNFLAPHGVAVRWAPHYFSLTHEKSLVVDGSRALIMTFNLVSKYYATGRDFGIVDGDARDVVAMENTFAGDWNGSGDDAPSPRAGAQSDAMLGGNNGDEGDDLLWSPGAAPALLALINGAQTSLSIYNEEMDDPEVTKALIDAAERGVAVDVDMTGATEWKWDFEELTTAGAHVRVYADDDSAPLYIHAKMIIADDARAFVGSENFSAASLNENRELGIMIGNPAIIKSLTNIFMNDWRGATPFVP